MLESFYYFIVTAFLYIEFKYIVDTRGSIEKITRMQSISESLKTKEVEYENMSAEEKWVLINIILKAFVVLFTVFVGIFTSQWPIWVGTMLINLVFMSPYTKFLKRTIGENYRQDNRYVTAIWINSVLGFAAALFVLINKFHLHLDILEIVKNFF